MFGGVKPPPEGQIATLPPVSTQRNAQQVSLDMARWLGGSAPAPDLEGMSLRQLMEACQDLSQYQIPWADRKAVKGVDESEIASRRQLKTAAAENYQLQLAGTQLDIFCVPPKPPPSQADVLRETLFDYLRGRQLLWRTGFRSSFIKSLEERLNTITGNLDPKSQDKYGKYREIDRRNGFNDEMFKGKEITGRIPSILYKASKVGRHMFAGEAAVHGVNSMAHYVPLVGSVLSLAKAFYQGVNASLLAWESWKVEEVKEHLRDSPVSSLAVGGLTRLITERLETASIKVGGYSASGICGLLDPTGITSGTISLATSIALMVRELFQVFQAAAIIQKINEVLRGDDPAQLKMKLFTDFPLLGLYVIPSPKDTTFSEWLSGIICRGPKFARGDKTDFRYTREPGLNVDTSAYLGYSLLYDGTPATKQSAARNHGAVILKTVEERMKSFDRLITSGHTERQNAPCVLLTKDLEIPGDLKGIDFTGKWSDGKLPKIKPEQKVELDPFFWKPLETTGQGGNQ